MAEGPAPWPDPFAPAGSPIVEPGPLVRAAATGDRRAVLVVLRDAVAARIERSASPRDLAPLVNQFREILSDLETLGDPEAKDAVDEIQEARAKRRAAGAGPHA